MKNNAFSSFEKTSSKSKMRRYDGYRRFNHTDLYQQVIGFTCMFCKQIVSADPILSGVNNRNHCPYCLTSKHVDLFRAGDRLNACKGSMHPIGLTWKKTNKKYGISLGELMIIHHCQDCHQFSVNRIAADDRPDLIQRLFQESINLPLVTTNQLLENGIQPVMKQHESQILACLFGYSYL